MTPYARQTIESDNETRGGFCARRMLIDPCTPFVTLPPLLPDSGGGGFEG